MSRQSLSLFVGLLMLASALVSACQPVRPQAALNAQRSVNGEIYLPGVEGWGGISLFQQYAVTEVDPATHAATGVVKWRVFQPQPPAGEPYWKVVDAQARNIFFGADEPGADPATVVIVSQITDKSGWGQGAPGEYAYFWLRDGGAEPDQWGMRYYTLDPWAEFFPPDKSPAAAGYFTIPEMQGDDPLLPLTIDNGDITIHP